MTEKALAKRFRRYSRRFSGWGCSWVLIRHAEATALHWWCCQRAFGWPEGAWPL